MQSYREKLDEQVKLLDSKADSHPYFMLRISERRYAIVQINSGVSGVIRNNETVSAYRHVSFVPGCEKLTWEEARVKIGELVLDESE